MLRMPLSAILMLERAKRNAHGKKAGRAYNNGLLVIWYPRSQQERWRHEKEWNITKRRVMEILNAQELQVPAPTQDQDHQDQDEALGQETGRDKV
jgi:hypothetical protein